MRRLLFAAAILATLVVVPAASAWTWPADGPVLRPFSLSADPYAAGQHRGVDIGAPEGTRVRAPAAGMVSFVGSVPNGGRVVTIQTADGYAVTLLQLGSTAVLRGAPVEEGSVVGAVGPSADPVTLESHVHLGIRTADDPNGYVDPLGLLPPRAPASPPA
ncbi:MAG: M23 family metallopeptidase, partial [Actinobacteria bacterium]|nr:M23 family metallopeptidase [Actinomycetota bacterium]